jgi:hypothetical protein
MVLVLAAITLFWRAWIEALIRVDPDGGDGSLEWIMVAVLLLIAVALCGASRREWRRAADMTKAEVPI